MIEPLSSTEAKECVPACSDAQICQFVYWAPQKPYGRAAEEFLFVLVQAVTNFGHRSYSPKDLLHAPTTESTSAFRSKSASQNSVPQSQGEPHSLSLGGS